MIGWSDGWIVGWLHDWMRVCLRGSNAPTPLDHRIFPSLFGCFASVAFDTDIDVICCLDGGFIRGLIRLSTTFSTCNHDLVALPKVIVISL